MRIIFSIALLMLCFGQTKAQGIYVPLGSPSTHMLDRFEIKQGFLSEPIQFNTTAQSFKRVNIAHYADSFDRIKTPLSNQDLFNLQYLRNDNFEFSDSKETETKGLWKTQIYKHKAAFFDFNVPEFKLVINPLVYLKAAYDTKLGDFTYINTRGIEMRGSLGKRIGFYTCLADEIQLLTSWDREYYAQYDVLPGQAWTHREKYPTLSHWLASGYVSVMASKHLDFQFGHGRNFIGNGYRTLIMSDFAPDNLFLRMNTRIWKINYTNIWGEMYDYVPFTVDRNNTKRHYYALTHASINVTKKLNIGAFQIVSFQRDSGHSIKGYDPQYLNPIIFFLPIEVGLNSPDKMILGGDFKYNFAKQFSLYGQAIISELVVKELFSNSGWWGNKVGLQLGIKYIDVLNINNLDLQLEYNTASPYMYTSYDPKNAYTSYNQNMAHPTGANFREFISIMRYQPLNKLFITAKASINMYGNDTNGSNWGKDIRLSYNSRENEYGTFIGQGVRTELFIFDLTTSYMIWHNLFVDAQITYRNVSSALSQFESNTINCGLAIRWNLNSRQCHY